MEALLLGTRRGGRGTEVDNDDVDFDCAKDESSTSSSSSLIVDTLLVDPYISSFSNEKQ
jgi:hypothetical protein